MNQASSHVHAKAKAFARRNDLPANRQVDRTEVFLGGKRRCGRADLGNDLLRGVHCETAYLR
jgi:hypothetical protein